MSSVKFAIGLSAVALGGASQAFGQNSHQEAMGSLGRQVEHVKLPEDGHFIFHTRHLLSEESTLDKIKNGWNEANDMSAGMLQTGLSALGGVAITTGYTYAKNSVAKTRNGCFCTKKDAKLRREAAGGCGASMEGISPRKIQKLIFQDTKNEKYAEIIALLKFQDEKGYTPLELAIKNKNTQLANEILQIMEMLLEKYKHISTDTDILDILNLKDIDHNKIKNKNLHNTPLTLAAQLNQHTIVSHIFRIVKPYLRSENEEIRGKASDIIGAQNADGYTLVTNAAKYGCPEIVNDFFALGIDDETGERVPAIDARLLAIMGLPTANSRNNLFKWVTTECEGADRRNSMRKLATPEDRQQVFNAFVNFFREIVREDKDFSITCVDMINHKNTDGEIARDWALKVKDTTKTIETYRQAMAATLDTLAVELQDTAQKAADLKATQDEVVRLQTMVDAGQYKLDVLLKADVNAFSLKPAATEREKHIAVQQARVELLTQEALLKDAQEDVALKKADLKQVQAPAIGLLPRQHEQKGEGKYALDVEDGSVDDAALRQQTVSSLRQFWSKTLIKPLA